MESYIKAICALNNIVEKCEFRRNGHFHNYSHDQIIDRYNRSTMNFFFDAKADGFDSPNEELYKKILDLQENHRGDFTMPIYSQDLVCPECASPTTVKFAYDTNAQKFILEFLDPCEYPEGFGEYFVRLNVPSGKLVFGNDFRDLCSVQAGGYDMRSRRGTMKITQVYADGEMIHIYVGNSCPGIFKDDSGTLRLGCDLDEEDEGVPIEGKRAGGICTDLWWYSAMDYDFIKTRFLEDGTEEEFTSFLKSHCDIVEVEPGQYEASARKHLYQWPHPEYDYPQIYSVIRRVGPVAEKKFNTRHVEAAKFLEDPEKAIKVYMGHPLYKKSRSTAIARILDYGCWKDGVFHPEFDAELEELVGKVLDNIVDLEAIEPPTEEEVWLSSYSKSINQFSDWLAFPDYIRPDWLKLVYERLDNVIEGSESDYDIELAKSAKTKLKDKFADK